MKVLFGLVTTRVQKRASVKTKNNYYVEVFCITKGIY